MDDQTRETMIMTLTAAALRGMAQEGAAMEAREPGTYPPIDDAVMFDVAIHLAAATIEASPDYADKKRLKAGADMARERILDEVRHIRRQSEALGTKLLYLHMQAATGTAPVANDRG